MLIYEMVTLPKRGQRLIRQQRNPRAMRALPQIRLWVIQGLLSLRELALSEQRVEALALHLKDLEVQVLPVMLVRVTQVTRKEQLRSLKAPKTKLSDQHLRKLWNLEPPVPMSSSRKKLRPMSLILDGQ
jgi:hypothetical protein